MSVHVWQGTVAARRLEVHRADAGGAEIRACNLLDPEQVNMTIPAGDASQIADGLCAAVREAAGLPTPIILEHPDLAGDNTPFADGVIRVRSGLLEVGDFRLTRQAALMFAAHAAAWALTMPEPEPDVEWLTGLLRDHASRKPWATSTETARMLLAAGVRLPQRQEGEQ